MFANIARRDGRRLTTVQGFTEAGSLPEIARAGFEERLAASGFALPPGYRMEWGGEFESAGEAMASLGRQMPLSFGIMLLINLGLGLCTQPVGTCLFVGCAVGKIRIEQALKSIWPFYIAIFVALMLITFVPAISLTLPGLID